MEIIEVVDGGLQTTVQDLGRYNYQLYGVPVSGAMDLFAMRAANIAVGNPERAAGLEITMLGPQLRFLGDTVIAVTGGDLEPLLDGDPLPTWQPVPVSRGNILSFGSIREGMRSYVAIAGGIDVPMVLGSRSTYTKSRLGGLGGRAIQQEDRISSFWDASVTRVEGRGSFEVPRYRHHQILRVVMGPQDDMFTLEGIHTFLSSTYTVTPQSDRVGYRLQGSIIEHKAGADIVSDGIPFGAVQVAGDGMPIVLLADRGTTGGYTKIASVISADIGRLAQAIPGDTVSFQQVTVKEAQEALRLQEEILRQAVITRPVVLARRLYRVNVDGEPYDALTQFQKLEHSDLEARGSASSRMIEATVDGETFKFCVDVDGYTVP